MGTYLTYNYRDHTIEKTLHLSVMKLYYPTELSYAQSEIPDGSLPVDLPVKYLSKYFVWLEKIQFIINKLPDAFMLLAKNASCQSLEEWKGSIITDMKTIQSIQAMHTKHRAMKFQTWLSVG